MFLTGLPGVLVFIYTLLCHHLMLLWVILTSHQVGLCQGPQITQQDGQASIANMIYVYRKKLKNLYVTSVTDIH